MTRIDVGLVLRHSANHPYANLVTRHTGAAVRRCIEVEIAALRDGDVALLDFSHIGLMDYSCADEIVAKLLQAYIAPNAPSAYVVFHGITDAHLEAIEDVLLHHSLALVVHFADGAARLVGSVSDDERAVWDLVYARGAGDSSELAIAAGRDHGEMQQLLETLLSRRLLRADGNAYAPLQAA